MSDKQKALNPILSPLSLSETTPDNLSRVKPNNINLFIAFAHA